MSSGARAEGWWRAPNGQWYPPVEGIDTHDFDDDNGPVPSHHHPNGGGWVANTATVAGTAFVGPSASVFDLAQVQGSASVLDSSWVRGKAQVSGNARICGDSVVDGNARVFDYAEVSDNAFVSGSATLREHAQVGEDTHLTGQVLVGGNTRIFEVADESSVSAGTAECANGHTVDADASFCTICGEPKLSVQSCPACGAEAIPSSSFCVECGHSLPDLNDDYGTLDPPLESGNAGGKQRGDELDNAPSNQPVIPQTFIADELAKLGALRDSGLLTDEEFAQQKTKLLDS